MIFLQKYYIEICGLIIVVLIFVLGWVSCSAHMARNQLVLIEDMQKQANKIDISFQTKTQEYNKITTDLNQKLQEAYEKDISNCPLTVDELRIIHKTNSLRAIRH